MVIGCCLLLDLRIRIEYISSMRRQGARDQLRTVRFSEAEAARVDAYLESNPLFDSFSSLARVATLTFLGEAHRFRLEPAPEACHGRGRPRFLWDYDLSVAQVRELLAQPGLSDAKRFIIERILSECRFEEVFEYLTREELTRHFARLTLPATKRRHWGYALARWSSRD